MYVFNTINNVISCLFSEKKVFDAARKHKTKRNKTGFILYACGLPHLTVA